MGTEIHRCPLVGVFNRISRAGLIQRFVHSPVAVVILDKCLNRGRDCLLGSPGDHVRMLPYVIVIGIKNGSNGRQLYDVCFDVGLVSVPLQAANVECGSYTSQIDACC